jgi:CDP-diacylglycerol--glycerol-3-phosphate 3-phosphatidyltransferase
MNLPNKLTLLRILLTFLIMGLLFVPGLLAKGLCLGLFLLASATDWWDGYLARRRRQITPLGVLLDPIADKVLVVGLLLAFVQLRLVQAWMALVIVIREFLITGVRLYAASRRVVIPAAREGKHKTISQMLTILVVLALLVIQEWFASATAMRFSAWMSLVIFWLMWITVVLTVISGASFFWRNRSVLLDAMAR